MREQPNDTWMTAIVNASSDAIISFSLDGSILSWNPGATAMFGYTADEAVGQSWNLLTPPDLRDEHRIILHHLMSGDSINQVESVRVRKNGERFPVMKTISPVRDATTMVVGAVAIVQDITEQKYVEKTLRASQERQAYLLNLSDALRPLSDGGEIKATATRLLGEHLGVNRAFYADAKDDHWMVTEGYVQGVEPLWDKPYVMATCGQWIIEDFHAGYPLVVRDVRSDTRMHPSERTALEALQIVGAAGRALVKNGRLVAMLAIHTATPRNWTDEDLVLVEETAERIWAAVERARAEAALRANEERQRFLLALGDAMRSQPSANGMIEVAARHLGEQLNASRVVYAEFDEARGVADIFHGWFADGALPFPTIMRLEDYEGPVLNELRTGRIVRVDHVGLLVEDPSFAAIADVGVQALLSVPLIVNGRLIVNVSVHQHEARHWTDDEVTLVQEVSERLWAEIVRARAEAALRASEEKYRTLFETMDEGFALCEIIRDEGGNPIDYRYVEVNNALGKQSGLAADAIVGKRATEAFPNLDPWLIHTYGQVVDTQQSIQVERFYPHVNIWFRLNAFPRGGGRFAVLFTNITDSKRAEAALRESEERARTLIRNLPGGAAFILDRDLRYTLADGEALYAMGRTSADYEGKPVDEVLPPDVVDDLKAELRRALNGEAFEFERGQNGQTFVSRGVPLRTDDGDVAGVLVVSYDITVRKQAEEALARAYAVEHTARAEAEAALHTRDQFLSIASHELRTPLTSLLGYATLLHASLSDASLHRRRMTDRIIRQTERLNALIEHLLDVSRLQQGQFAMTAQPLDITHVVAQVVEATHLPSVADGSTITFTYPDEPVMIAGDAERLEQVMQNLLSNAIKYSPSGRPIEVVVRTTPTDAFIDITDQGIGIPQEAQARLFEPFYRAPNVGQQVSGFGLGLHIVQEIVERHSGRVEVESVEGEGSTFRVILPRLRT
jgi:PAS domain S-box-containing protein